MLSSPLRVVACIEDCRSAFSEDPNMTTCKGLDLAAFLCRSPDMAKSGRARFRLYLASNLMVHVGLLCVAACLELVDEATYDHASWCPLARLALSNVPGLDLERMGLLCDILAR